MKTDQQIRDEIVSYLAKLGTDFTEVTVNERIFIGVKQNSHLPTHIELLPIVMSMTGGKTVICTFVTE